MSTSQNPKLKAVQALTKST